mmetsp:Transcript_11402/g.36258  ORF Transcript_11402/g.36258 Transcript_11402/m.36258 type:complete len:256 (+) Transcript_11402:2779-3546(+)
MNDWNSSAYLALTQSISGTPSSEPLYNSSFVARISSLRCGMSTVMPGMYGARNGRGMGIAKQRAMLFNLQRISAFVEELPRANALTIESFTNISGTCTLSLLSLSQSAPISLGWRVGWRLLRSVILALVVMVSPTDRSSLLRTLNDCTLHDSLSHLSSHRICSMIRSHIIGKCADTFAELVCPKVKTFFEKRSGILKTERSSANWFLLAMMETTPKNVQPTWNHTPVSATKRKKLNPQSKKYSMTSAAQLVLYQT